MSPECEAFLPAQFSPLDDDEQVLIDPPVVREEELGADRSGRHLWRRDAAQSKDDDRTDLPLFGREAYNASLAWEFPDDEVKNKAITDARAGDYDARAFLLGYTMQRAWMRSLRLVAYYNALRGITLDPQDVAQEASMRAWQRMDKALAHPSPIGYLAKTIEGAMLTYCREGLSPIRVPNSMQSKGNAPPYVTSLDAPLANSSNVSLIDLIAAEDIYI